MTSQCRPHVGTKSTDLGKPVLKNLPDRDGTWLTSHLGLHNLASVCHVRSTRMLSAGSVLWIRDLIWHIIKGKQHVFPFTAIFKVGQYSEFSLRNVGF